MLVETTDFQELRTETIPQNKDLNKIKTIDFQPLTNKFTDISNQKKVQTSKKNQTTTHYAKKTYLFVIFHCAILCL